MVDLLDTPDGLTRAGLRLERVEEEGRVVFAVTGDTFSYRGALRAAGGRWSRSRQAWVFEDGDPGERIAWAIADPTAAEPARSRVRGLAEAPAAWGDKHYHGHRERLQTRFLEGGADALPDYELLELLLFFSVPYVDVKPLAKALLERFGGLGALLAAPAERLAETEGVSRFVVVQLRATQELLERVLREQIRGRVVMSSWKQLMDYLHVGLDHRPTECFRLLFLDRKNMLIRDEEQSRGTVDHTPLYPREVVKRALELAASAVIMVHNHPSGDPTPSQADIEMTRQVVEALAAVGIAVHDHIIVGHNKHASFRSLKLL